MIKNNFFPTEVFYTKYKNKEKNICAIYKKSSLKENKEKKLFENLKKELTYKKVKNIYNPGNHKVIKININEINDLSLTYKPAEIIHQNILDNILERKIKFNTSTKNYEVLGKKLKITRKTSSKNNYEKFLDNKCIKLNNFLKKINNGL